MEDILSVVETEELSDFVLVGHSYAGMVISGVADTLGQRVSRYVYLDARLPFDMSPGASFSWSSFDTPEIREARLKSVHEQGKGVVLPPPQPSAFGVTKPSDVAWLQRHLRPMPVQIYIGTFTFKSSGSYGLKRTYIAAIKPPYATLVSTHDRIRGDASQLINAMPVQPHLIERVPYAAQPTRGRHLIAGCRALGYRREAMMQKR